MRSTLWNYATFTVLFSDFNFNFNFGSKWLHSDMGQEIMDNCLFSIPVIIHWAQLEILLGKYNLSLRVPPYLHLQWEIYNVKQVFNQAVITAASQLTQANKSQKIAVDIKSKNVCHMQSARDNFAGSWESGPSITAMLPQTVFGLSS